MNIDLDGEDGHGQDDAAAMENNNNSEYVDINNTERHLDDVEGCDFTVYVDTSKTLSFITANSDRYTTSKKNKNGLTMYLRCASTGCHKQRSIDILS